MLPLSEQNSVNELWARDSGRPVIVHPTGPSHNCQFLLRYESERRQKFEEQEARSARRIRQKRRDLSPYSVTNGVREVFDTESSSDEVQVISPLPPRRRVISPRPPIRRPRRKAADTVDLRDGPEFSASKKRKVKAETPNWTMEPRLWEVPDGQSRRIRATTSQLMSQAELSTFPDYVQTSESDTNASGIRGRLPLRKKLH
ncbi:MAG: hypothetical protein Q9180_005790 [Flavoplaca navasiana]